MSTAPEDHPDEMNRIAALEAAVLALRLKLRAVTTTNAEVLERCEELTRQAEAAVESAVQAGTYAGAAAGAQAAADALAESPESEAPDAAPEES